MIIPIAISIISLLVALITFYLTQLRPPKLMSIGGPFIRTYYADFEYGGSLGLYLPVTIINKSNAAGTVINAGITIHRIETPNQSFFIEWEYFAKLDFENYKWIHDEMAHALAIEGKSSITKLIWFMWQSSSEPKLFLKEGTYILNFYFWDKKGKKPICETHKFNVTQSIQNSLDTFLKKHSSNTIDIRLDLDIEHNKILTEHQEKKLLNT